VRVVDFVPLNALLPTCSAVVHHGGSGTFAAVLEHGVPQLIIPQLIIPVTAADSRGHLERVPTSPELFGVPVPPRSSRPWHD
jgi:hypothetical protein